MSNLFNKKQPKDIKKYSWTTISILSIFLFVSALFFPASQNFVKLVSSRVAMFADVLSSALVLETNDFRSTNNESALIENPLLTKAAQMKADDMAKLEYFSHIAPNGDKPWVWFNKVGYKYSYAGENLAVDFTESEDVAEGWINSAKHKANLLNTNFTEIGVGVAKGMYEGHKTIYVVQFFGKPFIKESTKTVAISDKSSNVASNLAKSPSTIKFSASTSPTMAVATRSDLPDGEVLGTEVSNASQTNNSLNNLYIIGGIFLVTVLIALKIVTVKEGNKTH